MMIVANDPKMTKLLAAKSGPGNDKTIGKTADTMNNRITANPIRFLYTNVCVFTS